jgi:pyochelin biosynthesis protein PchG
MTCSGRRPRVVVCGTKFGRIYLAAFRDPEFPFELAGILARGSDRSRACARYYEVPLFSDPSALPPDIDIACVVVGGAVNGGPGAELAKALMRRGIHVLEEHPLHQQEIADCLREARQHKVVYQLNTHYVHIDPVREFIAAARDLLSKQPPLFVDAACGIQTAFTLFDILGEMLGGLRPWAFAGPPPPTPELEAFGHGPQFCSLDGVVAGVPLTLRIQNNLDPSDPDNYMHFMHRIAVGTSCGTLTLAGTHGPVVWCPRAHLPGDVRHTATIDASAERHFDLPSAATIGHAEAPSYREILSSVWPAGIRRALGQLREATEGRGDWQRRGQYHLAVSAIWMEATARARPVSLFRGDPPELLSVEALFPTARDRSAAAR